MNQVYSRDAARAMSQQSFSLEIYMPVGMELDR